MRSESRPPRPGQHRSNHHTPDDGSEHKEQRASRSQAPTVPQTPPSKATRQASPPGAPKKPPRAPLAATDTNVSEPITPQRQTAPASPPGAPRKPERPAQRASENRSPPPRFEPAGLVIAAPPESRARAASTVSMADLVAGLVAEEDEKIPLNHPSVEAALGEHFGALAALLGDVEQRVVGETGNPRRSPMPFRPSILTDRLGGEPIVLGPTRDSGSFGKIRDGVVILNHGLGLVPVAVKEWRTDAIRPTKTLADGTVVKKDAYNRMGLPRNKLYSTDIRVTEAMVQDELDSFEALSGPVGFWGARSIHDKIYLAQDPMAMSLFDAIGALNKLDRHDPLISQHFQSFARYLGCGMAEHLADIHRRGFVHVDGKADNVMLGHQDFRAAVIDFGGVLPIDAQGHIKPGERVKNITYLSPEVALGQPITSAHDIFLLGHMLLETLAGAPFPLEFDPRAAFNHRKDAAFRAAMVENRPQVRDFVAFRESVVHNKQPSQTDERADGVHHPQPANQTHADLRTFFKQAHSVDPELTDYVLEHLLAPEPQQRATAAEAAQVLDELATRSSGDPQHIARHLQKELGESESASRLMKIAELLTQPHIQAFGPLDALELA